MWHRVGLAGCAFIPIAVFWAPDPDTSLRSALAAHDFGHFVAFGAVTALFAFSLSIRSRTALASRAAVACLASLVALALGAGVELAQAATGGNGDPWDVIRDGGGALSAAFLLFARDRAIDARWRAAIAAMAIVVAAAFAYPVAAALYDEARARAQFPVLASFETAGELSRFQFSDGLNPKIVPTVDADGRIVSGMHLHLPPGKYPGIVLSHFPRDWRGLRALELLIFNPATTPIEMTVRIDDVHYNFRLDIDDRYNQSFRVLPGKNRIEIPLSDVVTAPRGRQFDLGHVQSLLVYTVDLERWQEIVVGPITLLQ